MRTDISWLDVKLGVRVMAKHPGLSLVSIIGMAVGIAVGAGSFAAMAEMLDPEIPLPEGDRLVALRIVQPVRGGAAESPSWGDFELWRTRLRSVEDLAAFRSDGRNLAITGQPTELVDVAEITASGFRLAATPPVIGRPLLAEDEQEGAPPVVVIAHDEWRRRFAGDPEILGRTVRLGAEAHTVVGVMPRGFHYPVSHRFWVPLRPDRSGRPPPAGDPVAVVGRLAAGATIARATAELGALGLSEETSEPGRPVPPRPRVEPYAHPFVGVDGPGMSLTVRMVQLAVSMIVVLVALNVAVLLYARTASRAGEIAVRTALGASRRRVVAQLFVESLLLSLLAAALGLAAAGVGLTLANEVVRRTPGALPFWVNFGLSPGVVVYAMGLAVLAAVVSGVLPALTATGRDVRESLQRFSSHGPQLQLGRTWTRLIVSQVAVAVAVLPSAVDYATQSARFGTGDPGYAADRILRARLSTPGEVPDGDDRPGHSAAELIRRLREEPGVEGVTFGGSFPGAEPYAEVEMDGPGAGSAAESAPRWARLGHVDVDLFRVLGVPILTGRAFDETDLGDDGTAIVVNRAFAEQLGGNVLGRRVRLGAEDEAWYEIVGVVPDFPTAPFHTVAVPRLYRPTRLDGAPNPAIAVRIGDGPPAAFAARVREIAASVDPALELHELESVTAVRRRERDSMRYLALGIAVAMSSVLLLSAAGIYAMMSFTVTRRRREIGIRSALGAQPRRLLLAVFARASVQIGVGVATGLLLTAALELGTTGKLLTGNAFLLWPLTASVIAVVGVVAAIGPARRGLQIEPAEALRME